VRPSASNGCTTGTGNPSVLCCWLLPSNRGSLLGRYRRVVVAAYHSEDTYVSSSDATIAEATKSPSSLQLRLRTASLSRTLKSGTSGIGSILLSVRKRGL